MLDGLTVMDGFAVIGMIGTSTGISQIYQIIDLRKKSRENLQLSLTPDPSCLSDSSSYYPALHHLGHHLHDDIIDISVEDELQPYIAGNMLYCHHVTALAIPP